MKTITQKEFYKLSKKEQHNFTGIIKWNDGTIEYYKNGQWHREDGPAVDNNGEYQYYYIDDKLHRLDGPALILPDGSEEYWISNNKYTKEDYWKHPEVIRNSKEFQDVLEYKNL